MYKNKILPYVLLIPALVFFISFLIYPFIVNIYNSFFEYESVLDPNPSFVWLSNYQSLFTDKMFINSLLNTLLLVLLVIIFQVGIALILALLVSSIKRFSAVFKTTFFLPIIIPATALGLLFNMFYAYDGGLLNNLLELLGKEAYLWRDPSKFFQFFLIVTIPVIWQYIGFYFVIFLTGLNTIDEEMLEAADIDGCSGIKKVFLIKIPLIQNITRTVIVLAIVGTLKVFDLPHVINPGGYPNGTMYFLGTYMYSRQYAPNIGVAASFAVILVILGVTLSGISNFVFKQNKDI